MGLSAGIVGLPNVGKSTIFNALTSGCAAMENYPFCTIDPNHGITAIPDDRLEKIARYIPSSRIVPAFLELIDIAGLVKGASQGEGLGNQFLGHIKEVDAIMLVTRCFEDRDVVHVDGSVASLRDIEVIETELILKDLETVDKSLSRSMKAAQTGNKELAKSVAIFERIKHALERGLTARQTIIDDDDRSLVHDLHLLTMKPVLYVANIGDNDPSPFELEQVAAVVTHAARQKCFAISIRGKIESEIMQLSSDERQEYYASLGISKNGLTTLAQSLYQLLNLCSFFTVNEKELHAWPIVQGSTALEAAACVHSDFAQGFVRADVYCVSDLERYGSENALRAAGKIRSEGKEYIVNDGDVLFFKATA
jgi:ribosome-binding ATPase